MIKILFVCHGNICRSPMAEFVMKHELERENLSEKVFVASAATSNEEIGNMPHPGTRRKLAEFNISTKGKYAVQMSADDYLKYDYIFGMDSDNIRNILRIVKSDPKNKIKRFLDITDTPGNIADPWFTGDFEQTYRDIKKGTAALMNIIRKKV